MKLRSGISDPKNSEIIEVHLEEPTTNHSDLNTNPSSDQQPTSLAAPSAPTAQEWAFASQYTLKNSKGYRHSFGQQVRSMMGTAVAGPDQGHVRFLIEIAPNGSITKVETLWKTSDKAEQLARKAIQSMPTLPPTPTGKPLIFERTISFTPFASNDAPIYRDDCLPDPSFFRYCEEMLTRYRDNKRVGMVSGGNLQFGRQRGTGSYYFSKYTHIWGWASWRRAWKYYDRDLTLWPAFRDPACGRRLRNPDS